MALQTVKVIKQRRMGKAIRERDSLSFFSLSLSRSAVLYFLNALLGRAMYFLFFSFFPEEFLMTFSKTNHR